MEQQRRLAAILFTDIVGSTAIMQKDEQAALSINKRYTAVLQQLVPLHNGEILNDFGDGSLCAFGSATQAVRCALAMQRQFQQEPQVPLRIGLHVGEMLFENGKVFGDGVNIASRIQSLGVANSILFSAEIDSKLINQTEFKIRSIGKFSFKNVNAPIEVFALANEGLVVPDKRKMEGKLQEKNLADRKWILAVVAALGLVVGYYVYQRIAHSSVFSEGEKSIAVLPFENNSGPDSEEYVSDGITQDIINNLSKISSLQKVIGWFSVRSFKKTTKTLKQIADELGVNAILSGSIQKRNDKIHIIAELIEVNSNKRLWGDEFEYQNKDILSIQSRIAYEIVAGLKGNVTPEEKKNLTKQYTENVEAYKLYRKGRFFWDQRTQPSFDSAEIYYRKAIKLDPDYALAYAGIADLYIIPNNGLSQLEAMPIARKYATKALLLDSTLSEALTTMGFIQSAYDYDWTKAKITLERAIVLNPNYPTAHLFYGNLLQYTGENADQGINEIRKALILDPLSWNLNYVLGRNFYYAHKYDSALEQLKNTLTLSPGIKLAKANLALVLLALKQYTQAFEVIKQIERSGVSKIFYYQGAVLSYAYAVSGDTARARTELTKSLQEFPNQSPYQLARVYILLNEHNEAITSLEKAYALREVWMYGVYADPTLEPIRNDPRFKALMQRMHLQ